MAVYMIQAGIDGPVKIGLSKSPRHRLMSLQTSNQTKLRIIRIIDGGGGVEVALHRRFAHLRQVGEWFTFTTEMLGDDLGHADLPIPTASARPRRKAAQETRVVTMRLRHDIFTILAQRAEDEDRTIAGMLALIVKDIIHGRVDLAESPV